MPDAARRLARVDLPTEAAGRPEGIEGIAAALPLARESAAVVHLPPALAAAGARRAAHPAHGVLLRADSTEDRALTALAARDLMREGLRVAVLKRPLGWLASAAARSAPCRRRGVLPGAAERLIGKAQACVATCYVDNMTRKLSQRELRNQSGEIMRALDEGEDFIVTRNGVPVGELRPIRRRHVHSEGGPGRRPSPALRTSTTSSSEPISTPSSIRTLRLVV